MESSNQTSPNTITDNNATLTEQFTITNAFNRYFSNIALDIQFSIKH